MTKHIYQFKEDRAFAYVDGELRLLQDGIPEKKIVGRDYNFDTVAYYCDYEIGKVFISISRAPKVAWGYEFDLIIDDHRVYLDHEKGTWMT